MCWLLSDFNPLTGKYFKQEFKIESSEGQVIQLTNSFMIVADKNHIHIYLRKNDHISKL
jgi:hypothetical protein